jgi:hypothetical protein
MLYASSDGVVGWMEPESPFAELGSPFISITNPIQNSENETP